MPDKQNTEPPFFKVCATCVEYFGINPSHIVDIEPGPDCDYCDDLTERPNYTPAPRGWGKVTV